MPDVGNATPLDRQPRDSRDMDPRQGRPPRKRVNLALQGGGSYGAFTWGVLDALLEDDRIEIEGISGTSAGAMNAVVMANGLARDGTAAARSDLAEFWTRIGLLAKTSPLQRTWLSRLLGRWRIDDNPAYGMMTFLNLIATPYQTNPFALNPLAAVLKDQVDFDIIRFSATVKLFLSATDVETGKIRVFRNRDICPQAVMASACLPQLFQAVEYQGHYYWDGGYMGNPALWPLFYECDSKDILLVAINPLMRKGVPKTPYEIMDRLNEITFNSSLMREMRAMRFVARLVESGSLKGDEYRDLRIHAIQADAALADLHASSKLNAEPEFLRFLFEKGRETALTWLDAHFDAVGKRTSIDVVADYL